MKPVVTTVPRFSEKHGWVNRILRIDLSTMQVSAEPTAPRIPDYLAARGLAARIAWEEYPEPVEPFAPENPLMVFAGVLTGTRSPCSGRANVCTFSPQAYPYRWFTRSNLGGHLGGELKRAGYDGLIVTGASDTPVRILIQDDKVSILPADDLWGKDSMDTIETVESVDGKGTRSMAIGQAGENLSRIATIQTASSSACGHGGFGAVMGSKKLKVISIIGTGHVTFAEPERMAELIKVVGVEARTQRSLTKRIKQIKERVQKECGGNARIYSCTESCPSPCNIYYSDIPGVAHDRKWSGHMTCVGSIFQGMGDDGPIHHGGVLDWRLGLRGGIEMNVLTNRYGLNQWELITSIVPWLEIAQQRGLISEFNGLPIDFRSAAFWAEFLHAIAYREGMGDAIAEGGWAAAKQLGLGEDIVRRYYSGWGFSGHWDGHACWHNPIAYPFWLVSALQWLTDTRDPIPSGHGYVHPVALYQQMFRTDVSDIENPRTWDHMRAIAARVYGDPDSLDPYSGYKAKAYPAYYHTRRSVIKDCLPADDFLFPMMYSPNTPDHYCRLQTELSGEIEGPSIEYHLFSAGTGTDWSEEQFDKAASRIYTLERAIGVRHWARNRQMDEMVLPSFEYLENWQNPLLDKRYALDREQFQPVMDDYYALQGWDIETGWPTAERMAELGMSEVYDEMVAGAARAKEVLPEPPVAEPVPLIHE